MSGIKIDNISDYINLSSDCIFNTEIDSINETIKITPTPVVQINSIAASKKNTHFDQIKTDKTGKKAKITVEDCLACSGCITSSETVLIEQQNAENFRKIVDSLRREDILVVTISTQSIASVAERFKMTQPNAFEKLRTLFIKHFKASFVFESSVGTFLSSQASLDEFKTRLRTNQNLPVLTSECPGWICYAEKTLGNDIIPYMSKVKSSMAIMGSILKQALFPDLVSFKKLSPSTARIVHAAVMPCFDKKLEASRRELALKSNLPNKSPEQLVDCVLATTEAIGLISSREFVSLPSEPDSTLHSENHSFSYSSSKSLSKLNNNSSSGGHIQNIIDHYMSTEGDRCKIVSERGNRDYRHISLKTSSGVLNLVYAYGFGNITKITKKIRRSIGSPVHFVEILACPAGCLNGGGQIKPEEKGFRFQMGLVERLEKKFRELEISDFAALGPFYASLRRNVSSSLFVTTFNDVSKRVKSLDW